MVAFARADFSLEVKNKQGITRRQELQSVARQLGFTPPELDLPPYPEIADYVFRWFYELNGGRQSGMSANPLSWHEIKSWRDLTGVQLERWELVAIKRLDEVYLDVFAPKSE